jgi:anti-sigma regulatory factor (Ser/Thr protein kinase)
MDSIDAVRDDALIVANELVSNAVLHAGCSDQDEIELAAELQPGTLHISVVDLDRPGRDRSTSPAGAGVLGDLSLRLIKALCQRWGVERNHRVRVWAEIAA